MQITVVPKQKGRRLPWGVLPALASSLVIGYFAVGPAILIVAAATAAFVLLLIWSGPRVNERVYAGRPSPDALFTASAGFQHRSGRLAISPGRLTWTPHHRRSEAYGFTAYLANVADVELRSVSKVPPSCSLVCRLPDMRVSLTVFAEAAQLLKVLQQASRS
jgi:hypothetical protein